MWYGGGLPISFPAVHQLVPRLPQGRGHSLFIKSSPLQNPLGINCQRDRTPETSSGTDSTYLGSPQVCSKMLKVSGLLLILCGLLALLSAQYLNI